MQRLRNIFQRSCNEERQYLVNDPVSNVNTDFQKLAASTNECRKYNISSFDAGWNVANAIQGLFVIGLPFTVIHNGVSSLFVMAIVAVVSCYTGNILIECLYEKDDENNNNRVRSSYVDVAIACWGQSCGTRIVNIAQICELVATCSLYVVLSTKLLYNSFPDFFVNQSSWSIIVAVILFFCVFLRDLVVVSKLSLGCTVVHFLVIIFIIIYCFFKASDWVWNKLTIGINNPEFAVSASAIIFSYTSQIFLPSLEESMIKREEFKSMLRWSYISSGIVKVIFSLVCFLTWAENTKEVVTDNLPILIRPLINCLLALKALLSFPLPYFVGVEVIQDWIVAAFPNTDCFINTKSKTSDYEVISIYSLNGDSQDLETNSKSTTNNTNSKIINKQLWKSIVTVCKSYKFLSLVIRVVFVIITLITAIYLPYFDLLMSLTGSLAGVPLSIILPCIFHLQLKWKSLKLYKKVADIVICIAGALCSFIGLFMSIVYLDAVSKTLLLSSNKHLVNSTIKFSNISLSDTTTVMSHHYSFLSKVKPYN